MHKILRNGKRYNSKTFLTYEEARKYVRRVVTRLTGTYRDSYSDLGFRIVSC